MNSLNIVGLRAENLFDLNECIERRRSMLYGSYSVLESYIGRNKRKCGFDNNLIRLLELEQILNAKRERYNPSLNYTKYEVMKLHDKREREVLKLRLVDGLPWSDIEVEIGLSTRQCQRIYNSALKKLN